MKTIGGYVLALLGVGILALIVRVNLNEWSQPKQLALPPANQLVGAAILGTSGPVDQTGIVLLDDSHGYPPVPFLQYATADGVATKQLVFPWSRGCSVYAGDLPCVNMDEADAYPQLPTGTQVRVKGELKDDRILVYSIE